MKVGIIPFVVPAGTLYAQLRYLLFMVELPPDVAVFAAVCDLAGHWSILAPNHHPGGGVGVRRVAVASSATGGS